SRLISPPVSVIVILKATPPPTSSCAGISDDAFDPIGVGYWVNSFNLIHLVLAPAYHRSHIGTQIPGGGGNGNQHRHERRGTACGRGQVVAPAGGFVHALPEDAQLSLERDRPDVPDAAP